MVHEIDFSTIVLFVNAELKGLGARVLETQQRSGLTKGEFCKRAGIAISTLRAYAEGGFNPSYKKLVAIAAAGDVSLAWLVTGEEAKGANDTTVVTPAVRLQVRTLAQQALHLIESVEHEEDRELSVERKAEIQAELIIEGLMTGSYDIKPENVVDLISATEAAA